MNINRRRFTLATLGAGAALGGLARPAILHAAEALAIGYVPANAIHWVIDVVFEKGFFKDEGFEAQPSVFQSAPQAIQQLIAGGYQVASAQPEPVVSAIERGAAIGAFAAPANTPDWTLHAQPAFKTLADLKGKTIGVSALNSSEVWLTNELMERAGLHKGDWSFIPSGISTLKVTALERGAIAATILFQPTAELARRQGFPPIAKYSGLHAYPSILYAMSRDWAARGEAGQRVSRAIAKAQAWLWDPGNRAEAIAILGKYTKRETDICQAIYEQYFVTDKLYSRDGAIDMAGFAQVLAVMARETDIVKAPVPPPTKFVLEKNLGGLFG
jgi:ABC-type nitrate/sulfonate/bicarbonate transport system substrate-binding protein